MKYILIFMLSHGNAIQINEVFFSLNDCNIAGQLLVSSAPITDSVTYSCVPTY